MLFTAVLGIFYVVSFAYARRNIRDYHIAMGQRLGWTPLIITFVPIVNTVAAGLFSGHSEDSKFKRQVVETFFGVKEER